MHCETTTFPVMRKLSHPFQSITTIT